MKFLPCFSTVVLALIFTTGASQAEIIFEEGFEVPPGIEILGNENGWQEDFNKTGPSVAKLVTRQAQEASPFPRRGMSLQPINSKDTTHRKVEGLQGKRIYFSYVMKTDRDEGMVALRFRSAEGLPSIVGQIEGKFGVQALTRTPVLAEALEVRKGYFIAGYFETSEDGSRVDIGATAFSNRADIPADAPMDWMAQASATAPTTRTWDGVEFIVASSGGFFDDLRLGTTWESVTQR